MRHKDKEKLRKKLFQPILLIFWPLSFLLYWLAANYPELMEEYYILGFGRIFVSNLSRLTGAFPFSLAELAIYFVLLAIIIRFTYFSFIIIKEKNKRKAINCFFSFFSTVLVILGIGSFSYMVVWGINYSRPALEVLAGFEDNGVSDTELERLGEELIAKANHLRHNLPEDERGVMKIEGGFETVKELASQAFASQAIAGTKICPGSESGYGSPKPVLFSKLMSKAGIVGFYSPFTGEANINVDVPDFALPANVCHEMAHQRGFAQEDEANYIAWVVCSASSSPEFKYSGTVDALIYVMNTLEKKAPDKAQVLQRQYGEGLLRDLIALKQYWESYEGKTKELALNLNNVYLKSHRQEEGVNSYDQMVHLIVREKPSSKKQK